MTTTQLAIGRMIALDWNAAKELGKVGCCDVRVEAFGVDWIVVRDGCGEPLSAAFASPTQFENFLSNTEITT